MVVLETKLGVVFKIVIWKTLNANYCLGFAIDAGELPMTLFSLGFGCNLQY